jgi:hypothetical protein
MPAGAAHPCAIQIRQIRFSFDLNFPKPLSMKLIPIARVLIMLKTQHGDGCTAVDNKPQTSPLTTKLPL